MKALVVDDDRNICQTLVEILQMEDIESKGLNNIEDAIIALDTDDYDLLITDQRLPDGEGLDLLDQKTNISPSTDAYVITGWGNIELAVEAMRRGAKDFMTKPLDMNDFSKTIANWRNQRQKEHRLRIVHTNQSQYFEGVLGNNPLMLKAVELMERIADNDIAVLINGETGTGKELIAHGIHKASSRRNKPFINVNCAAIPDNLLESELFGYERGAFTGAVTRKKGKFQLAQNGTIFLDEIGDLSMNTQAKLLRVLQEKVLEPLGSEESIDLDVRIVAATNKNLEEMVQNNSFREDLFYRLNVVNIKLPTLMERIDDLPEFVMFFINKFNERFSKNVQGVAEGVIDMLKAYTWPGNIRELSNIIERAVVLAKRDTLQIEDFNLPSLRRKIRGKEATRTLKKAIENMEKNRLAQALAETGGNQVQAAQKLGMKRTTLRYKLQKYRLIAA
ncbi:MAG: sigma-54-dependent transcriptional regulator [Candidatus Zixiibacteriota bacterium]